MISTHIEDRVVNQLGISVGTALALESIFDIPLFDKTRVIPNKVKADKYPNHVYNVLTLFRNVINSIQYKDKELLIINEAVHEQLLNDMYNIKMLYERLDINLMFYLPTYDSMHKDLSSYKEKESVYKPFINYAFLRKSTNKIKFPDELYKSNNGKLGKLVGKTLMLTHYTTDLLNINHIPQLEILESHTGKIKSKSEWGSKYHPIGKRDLTILPFHRKLLIVLGDKTIVKPDTISRRREVYDIAISKKWHPNMSKIKLEQDLLDIII